MMKMQVKILILQVKLVKLGMIFMEA